MVSGCSLSPSTHLYNSNKCSDVRIATNLQCYYGNRAPLIDRHILHTMESVVIDWSHQIRDVLKRDSAESLAHGLSPLPSSEVKFWSDRFHNLKSIYEQVSLITFHSNVILTVTMTQLL